jgi:hypothetical protein
MPHRESDAAVLSAAYDFIRDAEVVKDDLVRLGPPATCVIDLRAAVNVFESTINQRQAGRSGVASSTGEMKAAFAANARTLAKLDIVVSDVVKNNAGLIASARVRMT